MALRVVGGLNQTRIVERVVRGVVIDFPFKNGILSATLIGSVARGENLVIEGRNMSDLEITIVVSWENQILRGILEVYFARRIRAKLASLGLHMTVTVGIVTSAQLRDSASTLLAMDACIYGITVFQSKETKLALLPVSNWESVRLVFNRCLALCEAIVDRDRAKIEHTAANLVIALGDMRLILARMYDPSLRRKLEIARQVATRLHPQIREGYQNAIEFRLGRRNFTGMSSIGDLLRLTIERDDFRRILKSGRSAGIRLSARDKASALLRAFFIRGLPGSICMIRRRYSLMWAWATGVKFLVDTDAHVRGLDVNDNSWRKLLCEAIVIWKCVPQIYLQSADLWQE